MTGWSSPSSSASSSKAAWEALTSAKSSSILSTKLETLSTQSKQSLKTNNKDIRCLPSLFKVALRQEALFLWGAESEQRAEPEDPKKYQEHPGHITKPQIVGIQYQADADDRINGSGSPTATNRWKTPAGQTAAGSPLVIIPGTK